MRHCGRRDPALRAISRAHVPAHSLRLNRSDKVHPNAAATKLAAAAALEVLSARGMIPVGGG